MAEKLSQPSLQTLADSLAPLAASFHQRGCRLYLVGGIVRDLINTGDATGADIDLTTDAEPDLIKELLAPLASALWTQGERFGTIGGIVGGRDVEITTHRAESYDSDSRNPVVSFGKDLQEDLSRRDFTVNAMAIELPSLELHDPFMGRQHLADGVLATPLSAEVSFTDDPLRMLRAARFMSRFDLSPTDDVMQSAKRLAERLSIVSVERVADELERLLLIADPSDGFDFLSAVGLLNQIVPGLEASDRELACRLAACDGAEIDSLIDTASDGVMDESALANRRLARRAGLLWPVSDPKAELSRLRYSKSDSRRTCNVIDAVRWWVADGSSLADSRRVVDRVGVEDAAALRLLVVNLVNELPASDGTVSDGTASSAQQLLNVLDELDASGDLTEYVSPLSGEEVIEALGAEPGPVVGEAQKFLKQHRIEHGPFTKQAAVDLLKAWPRT